MALKYKFNVLETLKEKGYTSYRIRQEKIFGERVLQQFREGVIASWSVIDKLCELLECQPGDIVEYIDNSKQL